jgi:hypothetical protein
MKQFNDALAGFGRSVEVCRKILKLSPADIATHREMASAFFGLGKVNRELRRKEDSLRILQRALEITLRALKNAPRNQEIDNLRNQIHKLLEWPSRT